MHRSKHADVRVISDPLAEYQPCRVLYGKSLRVRRVAGRMFLAANVAVYFAGVAEAARWVPLTDIGNDTYYVDADALVLQDSIATIWLKTVFAQLGEKGSATTIEKWMHDCQNNRSKLLAITLYKSDGSVIGSGELPRYKQEWTTPVQGSTGAMIHDRICRPIRGFETNSRVVNVDDETS